MNKSVITSIQPYYVFLIIARLMGWDIPQEKTVEVRKDFPKDSAWDRTVLIYCSKNRKSFNRIPAQYQPFMEKFLGRVVGEFVCDRIDKYEWVDFAKTNCDEFDDAFYWLDVVTDYEEALKPMCLTEEELSKYGKGKTLYGWRISNLKIYDTPKGLWESFWKAGKCMYNSNDGCTYKYHCYRAGELNRCGERITRPPQSWCYVEWR